MKYLLYWRSRTNAKAWGEGLRVGSETDAKNICDIANKLFKHYEHFYEVIEKKEVQQANTTKQQ